MGEIGGLNFSEEYSKQIEELCKALEGLTEAAAEVGKNVGEALKAAAEAILIAYEEARGAFEKLADEFSPEHYDDIEWQREHWRDAGLLAAQKAAARAREYFLRLTLEKAREIRRGRKWRKRIDDRVYLIQ